MSCLVVVETAEGNLNRASLATINAATQLSQEIDILLLDPSKKEEVSNIKEIRKVIYTEKKIDNILAEDLVPVIKNIASSYNFIVSPSGTFSKNFMPRLAAVLDTQQISDIIKIIDKNIYERPIYAGNAIATIKSKDKIKLLTIRTTAFSALKPNDGKAPLELIHYQHQGNKSRFISKEITKSDRPDLSSARVIVSGGRGVGSGEIFKIIEGLADKLNAAIGASRAAVDAGYISNDYQVGQTGKVVAPELYIAVGISGAIQHLAGMKDSKIIVAINKDEDAPIFQIADYGLVGDLFSTVPEITKLL